MRMISFLFMLCWYGVALCAVDFDVVVVGSSPISLLEALYHYHLGESVLVLEEAAVCGGAWKSIDICGMSHVDLGCHTLGDDPQLLHFLQEYVGCNIVSIDYPHTPFAIDAHSNGYYPAQGCYEIMRNLLQLIQATDIVLLLNTPLESLSIDADNCIGVIRIPGKQLTTSKILLTPYIHLNVEYPMCTENLTTTAFYHLYLLIEDPTPQKVSTRGSIAQGVARLMNLSYFVGLEGSGRQLIVLQTRSEAALQLEDAYLDILKQQGLLDTSARILRAEPYVYTQSHCSQLPDMGYAIFEMLNTGRIQNMRHYIPKWTQVMRPFCATQQESTSFGN